MANSTDPARELGEIAQRLTVNSSDSGDKFLASKFGVASWSTEFVKILACILERVDLVSRIISDSDLDEDHKESALEHLKGFKRGFIGDALRRPWNESRQGVMAMKDHGSPIKFLSPTVRQAVSYPRLTDEETAELIGSIDAYLSELAKSDEGPEFVRQAITDGLSSFRFQLERIGWMGAGYTLMAFREVLFVYEISKREIAADGNVDAAAFLNGFRQIVTTFKEKVDAAKGWRDSAEAAWDAYKFLASAAAPVLLAANIPTLPGS